MARGKTKLSGSISVKFLRDVGATRSSKSDRIYDGRKQLKASIIFAHLQPGQTQVLSGKKLVWGRLVYVSALSSDDGEY